MGIQYLWLIVDILVALDLPYQRYGRTIFMYLIIYIKSTKVNSTGSKEKEVLSNTCILFKVKEESKYIYGYVNIHVWTESRKTYGFLVRILW